MVLNPGSSSMIRRDCVEQVGLFDETLHGAEDLEMWCRLTAHYQTAKILEPLTFVRIHSANVSSQAKKMETYHQLAYQRIAEKLPTLPHRWFWKRILLARMRRGEACMHFEAGNRRHALRRLWLSFLACPVTSGKGKLLIRLRMAIHYLLARS